MTDEELAAEATQYSWAAQGLDRAITAPEPDAVNYDTRPTSAQLTDAKTANAALRDRLDVALADADRQLRNSRHLASLLEQIARTLGADPLDLDELPALVAGCRAAHDQASIRASDLQHTLNLIKQADLDRVKAHLGVQPGQAVGIIQAPHTDQALVREPAYEAARGVIRQLPADAQGNARLWAAVEAALDAMGVPAGIDLTAAAEQTQDLPGQVADHG